VNDGNIISVGVDSLYICPSISNIHLHFLSCCDIEISFEIHSNFSPGQIDLWLNLAIPKGRFYIMEGALHCIACTTKNEVL
jgi:hypothetical protein